jgi:L-alanine-DL-glutamate epimerase-like enolase superfamily enzyme
MLLHGRSGSVARAQSAVDIAIWDLLARRDGTPLWKRLGAVRAQSVPAYASGGYYPTDFSPGRVAEEMAGYVSAGFSAVKMKIGGGDLRQDAARVAAVRDAIGSDVQLMLDANNAWRDVSSALRAVRLLEPFDPTWIEEPFSPDDIESHARLSALTPVPIATGEIEAGRWRHQALLERRAAAVLQTDAAVCGGITEYRRIADAAAAYGVPMAPHWFHQLHIHLVAATPNAQWVEYFVDTRVFNFQELLTESVTVLSGGAIELPQRPGLGFDFSEDALGRYSPGGWTKA